MVLGEQVAAYGGHSTVNTMVTSEWTGVWKENSYTFSFFLRKENETIVFPMKEHVLLYLTGGTKGNCDRLVVRFQNTR